MATIEVYRLVDVEDRRKIVKSFLARDLGANGGINGCVLRLLIRRELHIIEARPTEIADRLQQADELSAVALDEPLGQAPILNEILCNRFNLPRIAVAFVPLCVL